MAGRFPKTFVCLIAGFVGIIGLPPFGIFLSELIILFGTFQKGRYLLLVILLFCMLVISSGMAKAVIKISFSKQESNGALNENPLLIIPQIVLLVTSIILCFWIPEVLFNTIINTGVGVIGGLHG